MSQGTNKGALERIACFVGVTKLQKEENSAEQLKYEYATKSGLEVMQETKKNMIGRLYYCRPCRPISENNEMEQRSSRN